MTYEDAQPFVEKMYEIALWYHAKPNEFRKRAYEAIETYGLTTNESANRQWTKMCEKLVVAEREACAKVCDELETCSDAEFYGHEFAAAIRARGQQ